MAAFRSALLQDLRDHPLAWGFVLAGAITSAILWACIVGVPLVHESPFYIPMETSLVPPA